PDEPLEDPAAGRRCADPPYMTNRSVGTHDPFREVESAMLGQHRLNVVPDEFAIVRVYECDVFRDAWWSVVWIQAINRKQLGRPVVETGGIECPATGVTQPLSLREVELGLLLFLDIEVNPDPIQERSILRPQGFDATQE